MPLVKARLGEVCKYYSIDKGLTAESQVAPASFVAMCLTRSRDDACH
jgi:hypothetical protein